MTQFKKNNKSTVYYNNFFLQIIFYDTGLYSNIDRHDFAKGLSNI
jgi:hypothetical protein